MSLMPPDIEHQTDVGHFEIVEFCLTQICPPHVRQDSKTPLCRLRESDRYWFRPSAETVPVLPLAELAGRARRRGVTTGRVQVLLILDAQDCQRCALLDFGRQITCIDGIDCDVSVACVYGAAALEHVDHLHGLVAGFALILVLRGSETNPKIDQQADLAVALGAGGRVQIIDNLGEVKALLSRFTPPPAFLFEDLAGRRSARELVQICVERLQQVAGKVLSLPEGAPYGTVQRAEGCTGCEVCATVCPVQALTDLRGAGEMSVHEEDCTQCGMCVSACDPRLLRLVPRFRLS